MSKNKRIRKNLRYHLGQTLSISINPLKRPIIGSILINQIFQLIVRFKGLGNTMPKDLEYNKNIPNVKTRMNM